MTTNSFISAVAHRDDPSLLMLRSRERESLDHLADDLGLGPEAVFSTLPSDYPFRIVVTKIEYAQWCHDKVLKITYDNFKAAASVQRGGVFVDFLHRVWEAGLRLTDRDTQEKNDAAWDERDRDWR